MDLSGLIASIFPLLVALAISMARPMGAALVLPVFTRAQLGGPVQAGFAMALALPAVPATMAALQGAGGVSGLQLGLLGFKEVVAGAVLGLLFGLPVWAVQTAGELMDQQRGVGVNEGSEPGGGQTSISAAILSLGAVTVFVAAGGLGFVAEAIYGSYAAWPLLELMPPFAPGAGAALLGMLDQVVRIGLILAGPLLIALLVAELAVLLVARAVPRLNVFDIAQTLKNVVFIGAILLYVEFLLDATAGELGATRQVGQLFNGLFAP